MNSLDRKYKDLLVDIINNGVEKEDRTGTGTISVFGRQIRHNMSEGYPLLTTKKMAFKTMVIELIWFLRGDTNIKYLVDNGCNIWNGDCFANYMKEWSKCVPGDGKFKEGEFNSSQPYEASNFTKEEFINKIKTDDEFAKKWGELGPIYGAQWRSWFSLGEELYEGDTLQSMSQDSIDQIKVLIDNLKNNPDSRRLMVNAWNVAELDQMVLPPCHYGFQLYTRKLTYKERYNLWFKNNYETGMEHDFNQKPDFDNEYYEPTPERALSLMWNQRSVDTFLGLPFNIASYGLLLIILSKMTNMVPEELIGNLGDVHLYKNHIEQAKEQIKREGHHLPRIIFNKKDDFWKQDINQIVSNFSFADVKLKGYISEPPIKAPLSN